MTQREGSGVPPEGWSLESAMHHLECKIDDLKHYVDQADSGLKNYHDQSVASATRAIDIAMSASKEAIEKSDRDTRHRLDTIAQAGYMRREEYVVSHASLVQRVDALQQRIDRAEGKGIGLNAGWIYLVAGITAIGAIVSIVILITGR